MKVCQPRQATACLTVDRRVEKSNKTKGPSITKLLPLKENIHTHSVLVVFFFFSNMQRYLEPLK